MVSAPEFSRRMARVMNTRTVAQLPFSEREALVADILRVDGILQLTLPNQQIVREAEKEMQTMHKKA